ncbi:helix-turn-helix domain-containing protein [Kitasatospora sp. NPDC048286]|uniref:helix-turn-helix domain-containing protein n=1 Tax=Kitasatospora sp. NPDC048286 TaxID=3364047 RepID=UPI003715CC04
MSVETEEFAAMLRELKERSGRSYGALATRLHVSTSTLHRYCNGAAVPTEYAPVERLARVCGAGAEELVELHRRWILADAARRRESSAAGAPAGTGPAPAPRPEAQPEPGPDPTPGQEPDPTPGPKPGQEPEHRPAAVPDRPSAALPEEEAEVTSATPSAPPAGPRRRTRTRVLLSATAVAVLAAVVSGLVLREAGGTPRTSAPSAVSSAVAPSVAAGAAAGSAPTDAPAPAAPSDPAAADTAAAAASAVPEELPPPFHVSVLNNNWGSLCNQWFLSARSPAQVTPPPSSSGRIDSWAASQRMVPAGHLRIELTALGADSDTVVLNAMYVQVVSTRPAPKWNAYTPGSGCGGGLEPAAFAVDLDAATPRPVPVPGKEGERKTATAKDFPYRISANDPQVIDVDASTRSQDVSWFLELVWTGKDGRSGTTRVGLGDQQPFRTVGRHGAPNYFHNGTAWAPDHDEG